MAKYRLWLDHHILGSGRVHELASHLCGMKKWKYNLDELNKYNSTNMRLWYTRSMKFTLLLFLAITEGETVNRFTKIVTAFGDEVKGLNSYEAKEIIRLFKSWPPAAGGFSDVLNSLQRFSDPHMGIDNIKLQKKYCLRLRTLLRNFSSDTQKESASDLVEFIDA